MNEFQKAFNTPVDIHAEVAAYEEQLAVDRGEADQADQADQADDPDRPDQPDASVSEAETKAPEDGETEAPGKHPGNAFKALREKAKRAEDEARSVREEMARKEGEWRAWQTMQQQQYQQQQQQYQQPPPPIDPTLNPIDAITQQGQMLERVQNESQQLRDYIQQQQLVQQVQTAYKTDAERFMAQKPDFRAAYTHAIDARIRQLQKAGANQQQAVEQARREEIDLAYSAMQQGRSPAELIYEYAHDIYGYRPGQTAAAQQRDSQGRFTPTIEQEAQKAAAATSISSVGSPASRGSLIPAEEAVKLPDGEFDKWYDRAKSEGGKKRISWR